MSFFCGSGSGFTYGDSAQNRRLAPELVLAEKGKENGGCVKEKLNGERR